MGLIGNYSVLNKTCAQFTNGTSTSGAYAAITPSNYQKSGMFFNSFSTFSSISSVPTGYRPPYCYQIARKDGGIASHTQARGSINTSANLVGGRNLATNGTLAITLSNAQLDRIVSAIASGALSITATSAILAGAAALDADGNMTIILNNAQIGAIFSVTASGAESISGTGSNITALGNMEAEAGGPTELSPEALAAAVLNALLADYNEPGSVGEALNNVGASSNPWDSLLIDNTNPGSFGERVQKLLTTGKFLGLK